MKATVAAMLKGIDRYNPENLETLVKYTEIQARENAYDLEANLAVLKLYQFNSHLYCPRVVQRILLKALTNLPHTDFVLCKCLIERQNLENPEIVGIICLHSLLEMCQFTAFWAQIRATDVHMEITGFEDSIRKFICHVINITFQRIQKYKLAEFLGNLSDEQLRGWMNKYGWRDLGDGLVLIGNQEENIKTKNITEKIDFESIAAIMSSCR